jgi:hypothetical protein
MSSNKINLNYKVADLNESYTFHTKFISIRVRQKSYDFLNSERPYRRLKRQYRVQGYYSNCCLQRRLGTVALQLQFPVAVVPNRPFKRQLKATFEIFCIRHILLH